MNKINLKRPLNYVRTAIYPNFLHGQVHEPIATINLIIARDKIIRSWFGHKALQKMMLMFNHDLAATVTQFLKMK